MTTSVSTWTSDASVLWAQIERPESLNAIDFSVMEGLAQAIERLEQDDTLRVFVLRGAGERAFAAGGDLRAFAALKSEEQARAMSTQMTDLLDRLERAPVWTIACVNGLAYGGGCETMLAFDERLASQRARFGFTQAKFALTPGWGGLTRLVELVGRPRALRWLMNQSVLDADRALQAGLVDAIHDPCNLQEATARRAHKMARQSRELIGALKQGALRARELPRSQALAAELAPFARLWADEEHHRRIEEFFEAQDDRED